MLNKYNDKRSKKEITQMIEEILTFIANNSNYIQVLLSENGDLDFQKKMFKYFTHHSQVTKYFSEEQQDNDAKTYYSVFMVHGAIGMVQHWLKNDPSMPVTKLARMLLRWTE